MYHFLRSSSFPPMEPCIVSRVSGEVGAGMLLVQQPCFPHANSCAVIATCERAKQWQEHPRQLTVNTRLCYLGTSGSVISATLRSRHGQDKSDSRNYTLTLALTSRLATPLCNITHPPTPTIHETPTTRFKDTRKIPSHAHRQTPAAVLREGSHLHYHFILS